MNYFSVEVTFSLYVHKSQFCRVFSPQTSHKCSSSHPLHIRGSNHTNPLTSLQYSRLLASNCSLRLGKNFPTGNGRRAGWEDCFLNLFVHRRTAVAHQSQTRCFQNGAQKRPCCLHPLGAPTLLPLFHPFCWSRTYLQKTLQEVTSRDESFMPDISSYISERVKVLLFQLHVYCS